MRARARHLIAASLAAGVLLFGPSTAPAHAGPVENLAADLDQILADARMTGSYAAVVVQDTAGGERLYTRNADKRLLPASNEKLFTSAAALEVLGSDHRFTTRVLADGQQRGPVLDGNLYLRGGGDPTMLAERYDELAAKVAASGIRFVDGQLVADDTLFDSVRLSPDMTWDDEPFFFAAQVSALTVAPNTDYDAGSVIVEVRPGAAAGQPALARTVPETGYVSIVNRATTSASGTSTISARREHGGNTIVVTGTIPVGAAAVQQFSSVWEPTGYAADVFRRALARHGIRVLGATSFRATPGSARSLAEHQSMTLGQLLVPFLKLSNNGHAEVLVKAMGRARFNEGSWSAGIRAANEVLPALGVNTVVIRLADGSGLSRRDLNTPDQITNLLTAARAEPWFGTWYDALPIAGQPDRFVGGTLRTRMVGTPAAGNVHAKTGTLTSVTALSGYVTDADGHTLTFSILLNNFFGGAKDLEDRIAIRLATFSRQEAARTTGVPDVPKDSSPDHAECSWLKAC